MAEKFFKLEQITNNPYRDVAKFPLNTKRVDMLKTSIIENGLWQPLPARKQNGHIQLACGHHRVQAITELGEYQYLKRPKLIKGEVPLLIAPYTDAQIIKVMLDENFGWEHTTDVLLEGIRAARLFLKGQLEAHDKLASFKKTFSADKFISAKMLANQKAYNAARGQGVGRDLLMAYLGPNWAQLKAWEVQEVLAADKAIEAEQLDEAAYKEFKTIGNARKFRQQVAPQGKAAAVRKPVPVEEQAELVPKVRKAQTEGKTKEERRTSMAIDKVVTEHQQKKSNVVHLPDPVPSSVEVLGKMFRDAEDSIKDATNRSFDISDFIEKNKINVLSEYPTKAKHWETLLLNLQDALRDLLPHITAKGGNTKKLKK